MKIITLQINEHKGAVDARFGIEGLDQLYQIARQTIIEDLKNG